MVCIQNSHGRDLEQWSCSCLNPIQEEKKAPAPPEPTGSDPWISQCIAISVSAGSPATVR
jgi:hypothetical protein